MSDTSIIKDILDTALEREKKGHSFYLSAVETIRNEKGRQMFQWLASVEQTHIDKISRQLESIASTGKLASVAPSTRKYVGPADLPPLPEASGKVTADLKELDALTMAMKAEQDSIDLYTKAAREATDADASTLLAQLGCDEEEHLAILQEEYDWLKHSGEYFTIHRFKLPAE